jgi:hypothetical protein
MSERRKIPNLLPIADWVNVKTATREGSLAILLKQYKSEFHPLTKPMVQWQKPIN